MTRTRELLRGCDKGILGVRDDTQLPFYWLRKFANGEIPNPSVNRVQFLYEYLTRKPLV